MQMIVARVTMAVAVTMTMTMTMTGMVMTVVMFVRMRVSLALVMARVIVVVVVVRHEKSGPSGKRHYGLRESLAVHFGHQRLNRASEKGA
ncbi:hypothetical protein [Trinickia sp. Y13]|uniref:hypothetical protein n=1 Tax=Trinickia sp. Y13 TaxID=2917807 RepID=UPI0024058306|nr:hypothetical protein [Trinickia sp. Y13]MDG0026223.1 hypothetical protein [Trinickia sp. Y13]